MAKADPRGRYTGPAKAKLLNTNLYLGSTWIEAERFKFERRILTVADFLKQKTLLTLTCGLQSNYLQHNLSFSVQLAMKKEWGARS